MVAMCLVAAGAAVEAHDAIASDERFLSRVAHVSEGGTKRVTAFGLEVE